MTYNLTTAVLPLPIAPSQVPSIAGCSGTASTGILPVGVDSFAQGQTSSVAEMLNKVLAIASLAALYGGNGHGIISGLGLNTGSTLALAVDSGTAMIGAPIQFAGGSITVPDDTTYVRIWLKQDGTLAYTTSTTPPEATSQFLGTATTSGGVITAVDGSGRVAIKAGQLYRKTADRGMPTDTPPSSISLITETAAGTYHWDGTAHKPVGTAVNTQTITGTLALDQYSASVQVITPSGATRKVKLPATPALGDSIRIINAALTGGNSIQVRDSGDTMTLATLTPGQSTPAIYPNIGGASSTAKYPNQTVDPVDLA